MSGRHRAPVTPARTSAPGTGRTSLPVGRVLVAVTAIVMAVVAAGFYVVTQDVDLPAVPDRSAASPPGSADGAASDPTATRSAAPTVAERYVALGAALPAERRCDPDRRMRGRAAARAGVVERQRCAVPGGTLVLTTYTGAASFRETRSGTLERRVGSMVSAERDAAYYSLDPDAAAGSPAATVYWDDRPALQSARLTADDGTTLRALERQRDALRPGVRPPRRADDPDLADLTTIFSLTGCTRVPVSYPGASEELTCARRGLDARAGAFGDRASFRAFRARVAGLAEADGAGFDDFWFHDLNGREGRQRDEPEQGAVHGFELDSGAVLFVDDTSCGCYVQLLSTDLDARDLYERVF